MCFTVEHFSFLVSSQVLSTGLKYIWLMFQRVSLQFWELHWHFVKHDIFHRHNWKKHCSLCLFFSHNVSWTFTWNNLVFTRELKCKRFAKCTGIWVHVMLKFIEILCKPYMYVNYCVWKSYYNASSDLWVHLDSNLINLDSNLIIVIERVLAAHSRYIFMNTKENSIHFYDKFMS